jgi:hypothetical protein
MILDIQAPVLDQRWIIMGIGDHAIARLNHSPHGHRIFASQPNAFEDGAGPAKGRGQPSEGTASANDAAPVANDFPSALTAGHPTRGRAAGNAR